MVDLTLAARRRMYSKIWSRAVFCVLGLALAILSSGCSEATQTPSVVDGSLDLTT